MTTTDKSLWDLERRADLATIYHTVSLRGLASRSIPLQLSSFRYGYSRAKHGAKACTMYSLPSLSVSDL